LSPQKQEAIRVTEAAQATQSKRDPEIRAPELWLCHDDVTGEECYICGASLTGADMAEGCWALGLAEDTRWYVCYGGDCKAAMEKRLEELVEVYECDPWPGGNADFDILWSPNLDDLLWQVRDRLDDAGPKADEGDQYRFAIRKFWMTAVEWEAYQEEWCA